MGLQLPDVTGDTVTILKECKDAIERRQEFLRQQIAATLHTLEGREYEDQETISVLDCVASGANTNGAQEDAEELDHSTAEKAGALAESIRTLISRTADERLENLNDRLTETQAAFEGALQQLQFVDAAYHLQQLRREVEDEQAAAGAETVHEIVIKANEWLESMEGHLKAQLISSLWNYYLFLQTAEDVDWSQPLVTVFKGLGDSKLWEAAQTCSCLDAVLQEMSSYMIQYAVIPLLQIQTPLELVPAAYQDEQNQADYAILSATEREVSETEQAAASIAWVFSSFTALAQFLHREVFAEDMDITHRFMEHFWPQCCAQGSPVLGQLSDNPPALQTCIEAARNAESTLHRDGLLSAQGPDSKAMSTAVAAQEGMLYQHLQGDAILQLRAACVGAVEWPEKTDECLVSVNAALNTTIAGDRRSNGATGGDGWALADADMSEGGDGISRVWAAAVRIGEIVEGPMVALQPRATVMHVRAACKTLQDAMVMFGVLVIRSWRPSQGLRRALIHMNSARYLVARINLLPALLQLDGPSRVEVLSSCVDAARKCAAFAAPVERYVVEEQCKEAISLVQELPPLKRLDGKRGVAARRQIQKTVGQLQKLSETLTGVCSNSCQSEFMAAVLGPCCGVVVDRVLSLSDIGEEDSELISALCDKLWKEVVQTVSLNRTAEFVDATEKDANAEDTDDFTESFLKLCVEGRRLRAVAELLRVRMADVVQSWKRGKYQAAALTAPEVQGVVMAVFEDNDFRESCLQEVQGS